MKQKKPDWLKHGNKMSKIATAHFDKMAIDEEAEKNKDWKAFNDMMAERLAQRVEEIECSICHKNILEYKYKVLGRSIICNTCYKNREHDFFWPIFVTGFAGGLMIGFLAGQLAVKYGIVMFWK